uniref:Uncharacterized protein n=1 Tax=Morchella brunnea TaxID=1174671 RepID=A0A8K1I7S0_9PEZI|nr:hypothetical protein LK370_mgp228 [Morchella brunnea]UBU98426.1 hypothetical protein [Morchella brunnea]
MSFLWFYSRRWVMLFVSSTLLLLVNAATLRRERSIWLNRLAILILLYSGIIGYDSLYIKPLDTGIGIYGGLFHTTSITHSFNLFISILGAAPSRGGGGLQGVALRAAPRYSVTINCILPQTFQRTLPSGTGQQFTILCAIFLLRPRQVSLNF